VSIIHVGLIAGDRTAGGAVTNDRRAHRPQHNVVIASVAVVLVVSVVRAFLA